MNQQCEPSWSNAQGVVRAYGHTSMLAKGTPCNPSGGRALRTLRFPNAGQRLQRTRRQNPVRQRSDGALQRWERPLPARFVLIAGPIRRRIHTYLNGKQSKMLSKIRGAPAQGATLIGNTEIRLLKCVVVVRDTCMPSRPASLTISASDDPSVVSYRSKCCSNLRGRRTTIATESADSDGRRWPTCR